MSRFFFRGEDLPVALDVACPKVGIISGAAHGHDEIGGTQETGDALDGGVLAGKVDLSPDHARFCKKSLFRRDPRRSRRSSLRSG
ncbi:hypothetical protein ACFSKM_05350 [Ancylobacter dichloromethanicus]